METVLNLLSVVDNPMQDIPLAAVMRSSIVGMDDEEMAWMMAAYKRELQKGARTGVYGGAWRLWLEEGPGAGGKELRPGKGPVQEENPDREEGLITVGLCSIPAGAAHSISFKSL